MPATIKRHVWTGGRRKRIKWQRTLFAAIAAIAANHSNNDPVRSVAVDRGVDGSAAGYGDVPGGSQGVIDGFIGSVGPGIAGSESGYVYRNRIAPDKDRSSRSPHVLGSGADHAGGRAQPAGSAGIGYVHGVSRRGDGGNHVAVQVQSYKTGWAAGTDGIRIAARVGGGDAGGGNREPVQLDEPGWVTGAEEGQAVPAVASV